MNVPFVDLRANYQSIKADADAAVLGVMERCDFILGKSVSEFESDFAKFCGTQYSIGLDFGLFCPRDDPARVWNWRWG